MDDVKRMLEGFADQAAEGLPTVDIDAEVARGRRALRRIKRRRRVTGVLCVAAVSAAVLAVGNQVKWWGNPGTQVAGGPADTDTAQAAPSSSTPAPAEGGQTMSMFGASVVELVANQQAWNTIGCTLAPKGWSAETPIPEGRVVLSQPTMRTADTDAKVVLQAVPEARTLAASQVTRSAGKTFHVGRLDGRVAGQVQLTDRWLLVELPAGDKDWNPDLLRRFLNSCTVN